MIVEAGESSETLSQGWEALRLNCPLFVLKSVFENAVLTWPEEMLKYGARTLEDVEQILQALPLGLPPLEEVASEVRFALVRTLGFVDDVERIVEPTVGTITLRGDEAVREP